VEATCNDAEPDMGTVSIDWGDGPPPDRHNIESCPAFTNVSTASCMLTHPYTGSGSPFTITVSAVDNFPIANGTSDPTADRSMATLTQLPTEPTAPRAIAGGSSQKDAKPSVQFIVPPGKPLTPSCSAIANGTETIPYVGNTLGINCAFTPTGPVDPGNTYTLTLSINGPTPTAAHNVRHARNLAGFGSLWLGLPAMVFIGAWASFFRSRRKAAPRLRALALLVSVLLLGLLAACGGGFSVPPTPVLPPGDNLTPLGTYYVTVVGTDSTGDIQTTADVPLVVGF